MAKNRNKKQGRRVSTQGHTQKLSVVSSERTSAPDEHPDTQDGDKLQHEEPVAHKDVASIEELVNSMAECGDVDDMLDVLSERPTSEVEALFDWTMLTWQTEVSVQAWDAGELTSGGTLVVHFSPEQAGHLAFLQDVGTAVEMILEDRESHPILVSNALLRDDLNKLWSDHDLTPDHEIRLWRCDGCEDNPMPHIGAALFNDGELSTPTTELAKAIDGIILGYYFDRLQVWACRDNDVLFRRTINGVEHDCGFIADLPTGRTSNRMGRVN